jgi:hypothetical protein
MSLIGIPMAIALYFSEAVAAVAFRQPEHIAQVRLKYTLSFSLCAICRKTVSQSWGRTDSSSGKEVMV